MDRIEKKVFEIIRGDFKEKNINILELCPGKGNLTRQLLEADFRNIETMDIYPENFTVEGVTCHKGDLNDKLPFQDGQYDLVIVVEGIEHLEYQYRFASECNRILKKDGFLILTTPNINNFASRIRFLITGFYALCTRPSSEFKKDWTIEHIYPLTFWQLRHILHTSGLFIRKITTDHIRRSALPGIFLWPFSRLFTWISLREETEPAQRRANLEINRQMHSPNLYFGRTQILLTQKQPYQYVK